MYILKDMDIYEDNLKNLQQNTTKFNKLIYMLI